ncbi:MAG TPA: zf-HC2 domain-containing protein [Planctomycetota bacterium]|nr:zf-HC2 domain-containing protein [Planctomycetota bacterium]
MDCPSCCERLPEFLLDELPEGEAVLVHEHLNLCASCMRNYRELKGTGKALESVPALRAVQGSAEFKQAVRAQAVLELQNIVAQLPPDKRLKLEARRAARMSRVIERPQPVEKRALSTTALILLCGLAALAVILIYPTRTPQTDKAPAGIVSVVSGKVEQFYQRAGESHSAVAEGKSFFAGDSFSTPDNGQARFDLSGGDGSLFLGPASSLTFRAQTPGNESKITILEKGELGIQRADLGSSSSTDAAAPWEVRTEAGSIIVGPGSHVYLRLNKAPSGSTLTVSAFTGSAKVLNPSARTLGTLFYGQKTVVDAKTSELKIDTQPFVRVPAWRLDLVSDAELSRMFAAQVRITRRQHDKLSADFLYLANSPESFQQDWISDPPAAAPEKFSGAVLLPANTKMRHAVPFMAPLAIELTLIRDGQSESFAMGALDTDAGSVSVDVAREARLQIREKGRTVRSAATPAVGQSGEIDRVRLDILAEGAGFSAQVSSSADRSNALPLPKELQSPKARLWLQGLSDVVSFTEVKVSGTIPAEWLLDRLSK